MGQLESTLRELIGDQKSWSGTQTELADKCGVSRRTLIRWLNAARNVDSVHVTGGRGKTLIYSMNSIQQAEKKRESNPSRRRSKRLSAIAMMSTIFGTLIGVGQSIRRGRNSDAVGQKFLDFDKIDETLPIAKLKSEQLEKDRIADQDLKRPPARSGSVPTVPFLNTASGEPRVELLNRPLGNDVPSPAPSQTTRAFAFRLPAKTTSQDMRNPEWIEKHVYRQMLEAGSVNESDYRLTFALVGYVLRFEERTPAALLTYICSGGRRRSHWRQDIAQTDLAWADSKIDALLEIRDARRQKNAERSASDSAAIAEKERQRSEKIEANRSAYKEALLRMCIKSP